MSGPFVRLEGVYKRLNPQFTLAIDELDVQSGELLVLLGPTGAGKSTLLRLLTGVDFPDSGEIRVHGERIEAGSSLPLLRQTALVPQRPILLSGSVESNVAVGLKLRQQSSTQPVRNILQQLQLDEFSRRDAKTLSGGQVQLVALARALVLRPDLLLLDEPTANLDPATGLLIETTINHFRSERDTTVIWATHNLFQARRIADRVVLLHDGQIVEIASASDFFERPKDSRTAKFVRGEMIY